MIIPYEIRILLSEESVIKLVKQIVKASKEGSKIQIHPTEINNCFNKVCTDHVLYDCDSEKYQKAIDHCLDLPESKFIQLIIKNKFIKGILGPDEDAYPTLFVSKFIWKRFKSIVEWVKDGKYIINKGLFSLNTLTGEAYFKDKLIKFNTLCGNYRLFKEFLITDKKYLSFREIATIQRGEDIDRSDFPFKGNSMRIITELKEKLMMRSGMGRKFVMYEGKGYTLLTE